VDFGDAVSALPGPLSAGDPVGRSRFFIAKFVFLSISLKYSRRPSGVLG
jgi:hypothetical protein